MLSVFVIHDSVLAAVPSGDDFSLSQFHSDHPFRPFCPVFYRECVPLSGGRRFVGAPLGLLSSCWVLRLAAFLCLG